MTLISKVQVVVVLGLLKFVACDNGSVRSETSKVDRRMGVIGLLPTPNPPIYAPTRRQASSLDISDQLLKLSKAIPLSPYSSHNIFTVEQGVHGLGTTGEGIRAQGKQLTEGDSAISSAYDLELKIKALDKAKDANEKHHILSDGSIQCDRFIINSEFYLRSPNYPYNYPANITCEFQVYRNTSACGVELTVLRFDLSPPDPVTHRCRDRFILNGVSYCGRRQRGDTTLVPFPGMFLPMKLETSYGHGASGVLLRGRQVNDCREPKRLGKMISTQPNCVRHILEEEFTLSSPDFPLNYPHNSECWFHMQRLSDDHCGVELTVQNFSLEAASCMFDYLEASRKRICGSKPRGTKYYFPFARNVLSVRFRSDESITRPGFLLEGKQILCSEVGSREQTYNDPKTHKDFITATSIKTDDGSTSGALKPDDDDDVNYILSLAGLAPASEDEASANRQSLGRQLGQVSDKEIIQLYDEDEFEPRTEVDDITTTTDVTTTDAVTTDATTTNGPTDTVTVTPAVTGGSATTFTADPLILTTTLYVNDSLTTETIIVEETMVEVIGTSKPQQTTESAAEEGDEYEGSGAVITTAPSSEESATVDGVPQPTLTVIDDSGKTDDNDTTSIGACDEVYSGESFTLRSPKVEEDQETPSDCSFYIKRASTDICEVRILLNQMSLLPRDGEGKCSKEFLQIAATRFCGGDQNKRVRVRYPGEMVRLRMYSDTPRSETGFTARVLQLRGRECDSDAIDTPSSMNCDVIISRERTTLLSPHYPSDSPHNLNCVITVKKTSRNIRSLSLYLEEFDLEDDKGCSSDYLSVSGHRLCGRRSGERVSYSFPGPQLNMIFKTNDIVPSKGYRIHIRQERYSSSRPFPSSTPKPGYGPPPPFNRPPDAIALIHPTHTSFTPYHPSFSPQPGVLVQPAISGIGGPSFAGSGGFKPSVFEQKPSAAGQQSSTAGQPSSTPFPLPPALSGHGSDTSPTTVLTECGGTTNEKVFTIKSPNYPDTPPEDLHCVYNVEKNSNEVCQLMIEIVDLQMGARVECGRSFLQVGLQQRVCGNRGNKEIRTYHFTDDVMQLVFHTEPEGQDGGFHINVHQLPCGTFEPLGTYGGGINAISSSEQNVISSSNFVPNNHQFGSSNVDSNNIISISDHHSGDTDDLQTLNGNVEVIHTGSQGSKNPGNWNSGPQPHAGYDAHTHPQSNYHYVYYYLPEQSHKKRPKGKGKFDITKMFQDKFDSFASSFQFGMGHDKSYEKVGTLSKSEGRRKRPYRPQTVKPTAERPIRYSFVKNPYYRPQKSQKLTTRFKYPQVYTTARPTTYNHNVVYPNAYLVMPQPQTVSYRPPVRQTTRPTTRPPVRYTAPRPSASTVRQPSYSHHSRPIIRFTTPRPVYVSPPRPVYVTSPRPVYVTSPRPHLSTKASFSFFKSKAHRATPKPAVIVTPRPVINVTPSYPVLMVAPTPQTPHAIYFPAPQPSHALNLRTQSSRARPVTAFGGFVVSTPAPVIIGRSLEHQSREVRQEPRDLVAAGSDTISELLPFDIVVKASSNDNTTVVGTDSPVTTTTPEDLTTIIQPESRINEDENGCGRRITEDEFTIKSPEFSEDIFQNGFAICTYTITKSGEDKCSLVLEIEEFELTGECADSSFFIGNTTYCGDKKPSVHMVTSFSPAGELVLRFNESSTAAGDTKFSIKGRQVTCGPSTSGGSAPPQHHHHHHHHPSPDKHTPGPWLPINPAWRQMNYVGPDGRGRYSWQTINDGAKGVRDFRRTMRRLFP